MSAAKKSDRRFSFPRFLLKLLLVLILVPVVFGLVMTLISVVFTESITGVLPPGFDVHVRVDSAADFFESTVDLQAADLALATPQLAGIREILTTVRTQDLLRSSWFRFLSDIRVDAALYADESFVAIADLGIRSAVTRIGNVVAPYLNVPNLSFVAGGEGSHFVYEANGTSFFARIHRNFVVLASDLETLDRTRGVDSDAYPEAIATRLSEQSDYDLRILLQPESFLTTLRTQDTPTGRLLSDLEFSELALVEATVTNDRIDLVVDLPVQSATAELEAFLARRSGAPSVLPILPEETYYYSLVSGFDFPTLLELVDDYLDPDTLQTLATADRAAQVALGLGVEELIFSWTGDEAGVFGLDRFPEPVFFVRVGDENQRRAVFEELFSSFFVAGDESTEIDGIRVPRIVLPQYLRTLLRAFDVTVPEPYFVLESDYLFISASPEAVAATASAIQDQRFLARSQRWEQTGAQVPTAASVSLLFSLDRAVPAFLRGSGPGFEALRLYRSGVANVRLQGDSIAVAIAAVPGAGSGVFALPGFPIEADARLGSAVRVLSGAGGSARLFWMERSQTLVEYNPASGSSETVRIGEESWLLPQQESDPALWVVTDRGTVYRFSTGLESEVPFPIVTGERPSGAPLLADGALFVPVRDEPGLLRVDPDGTTARLPITFDAPLRSPPEFRDGVFVAYPKAFDATIERFSIDGETASGWPVPFTDIAFGSPVLIPRAAGEPDWTAFISQAGILTAWDSTGWPVPGFPVELQGVFYAQLAWSTSAQSLYAVSEEGRLYRISAEGDVESVPVRGLNGRDAQLSVRDETVSGIGEVYIYDAGAVLYGYAADLRPLEGFPVAGGREPAFGDINGDGRPELITGGFDDSINVYSFR